MVRRILIAVGLSLATASIAPAVAVADAPAHTPSAVKAFVLDHNQNTADLTGALDQLAPADRDYVIKEALTPARVVYSQDPSTVNDKPVNDATPSPAAMTTAAKKRRVSIRSCAGFYDQHDFTAKSYSWAGLWLFTYHSQWQWGGGCKGSWIGWANHQERGDTAIGWSYDGDSWGAHYGCGGCFMVGRETFGHFSFVKYAIHDTADLQVQVNANPGWWAWANITGP